MDRDDALGNGGPARLQPGVLPSRAAAIEPCRAALDRGRGPVLLTGAAGVGKTWLWQHLAAGRPEAERWLGIDLTPLSGAGEFFGRVGATLGLAEAATVEEARRNLADELRERAVDGRRWVLVVDEAHHASVELLEEIRILSNRLGRPGGFAGLLLVGQTTLSRRIETRPLDALEARLSARVHLRALDVDEARTLLSHLASGRSWTWPEVEVLHREAAGNPQRLLRLAAHLPARRRDEATPPPAPTPVPAAAAVAAPPIVPARPPLRVEDGLVEVGWVPPAESASSATEPRSPIDPGDGTPDVINDHYAALQAWNEWAQNQGRHPSPAPATTEPALPGGPDPNRLAGDPSHGPYVWAEGQQGFAPYSQLFSRLREAKDAE